MTPSGFGAVLFGWFTAEIGRQPYVVYGHLRTADAVSPITAGAVTASLIAFIVVYAVRLRLRSLLPCEAAAQGARADRGYRPRRPGQETEAAAFAARRRARRRRGGAGRSRRSNPSGGWRCSASARNMRASPSGFRSSGRGSSRSRSRCMSIADGFDLGVGILFKAAGPRELARPHDVFGRADLGRQRDVADPRRRRPLRRLPPRLRDPHAGALRADPHRCSSR